MMVVAPTPVFNEVYDFLLSSPTAQQIVSFRPSETTQDRIRDLLGRNQEGRLTEDEQIELDEFLRVEHFVRMLKIKARQKLG
jgi:hypothetical protein